MCRWMKPRSTIWSPAMDGRGKVISGRAAGQVRSEEHTSELQSRLHLVCRLLLEKKKKEDRRGADRAPAPYPACPAQTTPAEGRWWQRSLDYRRARCALRGWQEHPTLRECALALF